MNKKPLISIKQIYEDCHYETIFWKDGIPICCGRGITLEKADTEALNEFFKIKHKEYKKNIGQLRQWLNEDRIDDPAKIITDEDINYWLNNNIK